MIRKTMKMEIEKKRKKMMKMMMMTMMMMKKKITKTRERRDGLHDGLS